MQSPKFDEENKRVQNKPRGCNRAVVVSTCCQINSHSISIPRPYYNQPNETSVSEWTIKSYSYVIIIQNTWLNLPFFALASWHSTKFRNIAFSVQNKVLIFLESKKNNLRSFSLNCSHPPPHRSEGLKNKSLRILPPLPLPSAVIPAFLTQICRHSNNIIFKKTYS